MSALAVYASVTYRRLRFREQGLRESAAVAMERARASEHAIESRDVFLLIAAHELKTPLTSVVLNTDRLLRQTRDLNAPHTAIKETSEALHRQVSGVVGLVERLLDVSRLSSERPLLERTPMDIAPVIERAIELYRPTAQKHQSTLTLVDARPAMVAVDRTALQQVILNLLSNAVKFGVGKPVEVTLAVDAATARISVRDHGAGIGKADQERIFQRFERAGASLNKGGLGLGLWISRRLVEDMGGRLSVESAPEQGATFTVELPVVPARPARETPGAVSPAS